jgi:hypothetical protein
VGSDWNLRPGRFYGGGAPLSRLLLQVLGLLVALNEEKGQLNIGIPLRRWGNRLTVALGRLQKEGQEFNLTNGASITKGAHQALLILRLTG